MNCDFSKLDKNIQNKLCSNPQIVFSTLNPNDETDDQVIERQEKFLKLSEEVKDKLVSYETAEKIKALGKHYNLELLQMAPIARVIRSYYFGEVKLEDFAEVIAKESEIDLADAQNIARYVIEKIIKKEAVKPVNVEVIKMNILQALEKFPEIKNQMLTSLPIELNGIAARPTVGNWISDYYNIVGAGNTDVMRRSSYLYHSRNVKNLTVFDRQKLNNIIRSLDEGMLVKIDTAKREIFFDAAPDVRTATQMDHLEPVVNKERPVNNPKINPVLIEKKEAPKENLITPVVNKPTPQINLRPIERETVKVENQKNQIAQMEKVFSLDSENQLEKEKVIKHVQGNNWDLRSDHFETITNDKKKMGGLGSFFGQKQKEDEPLKSNDDLQLGTPLGVGPLRVAGATMISKPSLGDRLFAKKDKMTNNLKFSSSQQLPVEKEINPIKMSFNKEELESDEFNDFFGKIEPIE